MLVEKLEGANFRNYKKLFFVPGPHLNLLLGENASGKTNLLEAIYLCAYGRGFRGVDGDIPMWGESNAELQANFSVGGGVQKTVRIVIRRPKKQIFLGNKRLSRRQDLVGQIPVILSGAWDFEIAAGNPQARRRYLDGLLALLSSSYLATLRDYTRALKQRNLLLSTLGGGDHRSLSLEEKLQPWTESLIGYGSIICARRESLVRELEPRVRRYYGIIAGSDESVELVYEPNVRAVNGSYAEGMRAAFRRVMQKEKRRAVTLVGPHLDELTIRVAGRELRRFGSRGEQKTAVLSLRLAQLELVTEKRGEAPVLLVDDVFSDLDSERAERLLVAADGVQVIATSAEEERAKKIVRASSFPTEVFHVVRKGSIAEVTV